MKRILGFLFFICCLSSSFAQYNVEGTVYAYTPNSSTGIKGVYIANGLSGVTISYTAENGKTIVWYKYTNSLSDKTAISSSLISTTDNGSTTTYSISSPQDASGYLVSVDGALQSTLWLIDYSQHLPQLNSIMATASSDCSDKTVKLSIDKSDNLVYYANSGVSLNVKMQYKLQYNKQTWNATSASFVSSTYTSDWETINSTLYVDAPLIDTKFTLTGDYIADYLGISQSISSDTYTEIFTDPHIVATQTSKTSDNESDSTNTDGLGGSAPAEISFKGYSNDPVTNYYTWKIYKSTDLTNWVARYNDQNITYTFNDAGSYIVYLITADANATCEAKDSLTFSISESFLDLPNYFTPNGDGQNDEYKVAYKSLITFRATIFNRWGNKLYEWTNPALGWDGKYHGKYVTPGVYFVVVEAKGSDGVKYKKSRDINILTTH